MRVHLLKAFTYLFPYAFPGWGHSGSRTWSSVKDLLYPQPDIPTPPGGCPQADVWVLQQWFFSIRRIWTLTFPVTSVEPWTWLLRKFYKANFYTLHLKKMFFKGSLDAFVLFFFKGVWCGTFSERETLRCRFLIRTFKGFFREKNTEIYECFRNSHSDSCSLVSV